VGFSCKVVEVSTVFLVASLFRSPSRMNALDQCYSYSHSSRLHCYLYLYHCHTSLPVSEGRFQCIYWLRRLPRAYRYCNAGHLMRGTADCDGFDQDLFRTSIRSLLQDGTGKCSDCRLDFGDPLFLLWTTFPLPLSSEFPAFFYGVASSLVF
jgi:hypothetical protein